MIRREPARGRRARRIIRLDATTRAQKRRDRRSAQCFRRSTAVTLPLSNTTIARSRDGDDPPPTATPPKPPIVPPPIETPTPGLTPESAYVQISWIAASVVRVDLRVGLPMAMRTISAVNP